MPVFQEQRRAGVEHYLDAGKLAQVLRRKKPTKWFWCDMTDLFGPWVPFEWIAACFGVMAATPWHTHQVLTKRPERALEWFRWVALDEGKRTKFSAYMTSVVEASKRLWPDAQEMAPVFEKRDAFTDPLIPESMMRDGAPVPWPLPNVWVGTSVEDRKRLARLEVLREVPAAVHFVSFEPLLEDLGDIDLAGIDWAIWGGESGPRARPCAEEWIERGVQRCVDQGTRPFVKQLGEFCVSEERVMPPDAMPPSARGPEFRSPDGNVWAWRANVKGDRKLGHAENLPAWALRLFPGDPFPPPAPAAEECPF